ncbi:MAG TPA: hypothetical protein PK597_04405 [Oscillospiraceae bacterium]|nr:hypothetical protein [Oscillospiraceae bacterium]
MRKNIVVYITASEDRILSGDPLALLVKDQDEQKELTTDPALALRADVVQLKNGDYVLITEER